MNKENTKCTYGLPRWLSSKESAYKCKSHRSWRLHPWVRMIPWRRKWQPTPVFLPGKPHGQRSLAAYSPWGCKELDTTEWLSCDTRKVCVYIHTHTHTHTRIFWALKKRKFCHLQTKWTRSRLCWERQSHARKRSTTLSHLNAESKKVRLIKAEGWTMATSGWRVWDVGRYSSVDTRVHFVG